jgi:hypothetical protein
MSLMLTRYYVGVNTYDMNVSGVKAGALVGPWRETERLRPVQPPVLFATAGVAGRLRRAVIQMPVDPRSISPNVPGSGVGVGVPAENVPFTNGTVSWPCSSLTG